MKSSLTVRVERLERVVDEELLRRQKSEKYTHNMLEDMKEQVAEGFANDVKTDREMEDRIASMIGEKEKRLSRIEIALATSLGGLAVIAWLVNHAADNILKLLTR